MYWHAYKCLPCFVSPPSTLYKKLFCFIWNVPVSFDKVCTSFLRQFVPSDILLKASFLVKRKPLLCLLLLKGPICVINVTSVRTHFKTRAWNSKWRIYEDSAVELILNPDSHGDVSYCEQPESVVCDSWYMRTKNSQLHLIRGFTRGIGRQSQQRGISKNTNLKVVRVTTLSPHMSPGNSAWRKQDKC
jgi:hypothetical protein